MIKYQITELIEDDNTAGSKAVDDIYNIALHEGFNSVKITKKYQGNTFSQKLKRHSLGKIDYKLQWNDACKIIQENSVVLLQNPFYTKECGREKALSYLKKIKNVKFISLIHDLNIIRYTNDKNYNYIEHEFWFMIRNSDVLIVHNDAMKNLLVDKYGVSQKKIIVLGIFDYLINNNKFKKSDFEQSVNIAGNLDVNKAGYIADLNKVKCKFKLYGPNFTLNDYKNVYYGGVFPASKIPDVLTSGFGLVWDGNRIDTCDGNMGQYLRYNNPHKLSLYLLSGMPVIIWSKAAEARFVRENNVGYTVDSLTDIPDVLNKVDKDTYESLTDNAIKISQKLQQGWYTKNALKKAMDLL